MKSYYIVVLLSLALLFCSAKTQAQTISAIDEIVGDSIGANSPGLVVAAIKKGKTVHVKAYGLANLETKKPLTLDSVFDMASVSKQMTAVAVLTLVEAGKVKLEEPVKTYISDFAVRKKGRAVTVRDLLQMTSGLADYSTGDWDDKEFSALNLETHLEWVNETEPTHAPGMNFKYNNTNYALLALLVERVSGKSFSRYMQEKIFTPAGMKNSFVMDRLGMKYANAVTGYKGEKAPFVKSFLPVQIPGDGNVYATIADMAAWANALRTNKLISRKTLGMAWSAGKMDDGSPVLYGEDAYYGFGWVINEEEDSVSHSGSWDGTATYFLHYRELDDTVIVMSNNESLDVASLASSIGEAF